MLGRGTAGKPRKASRFEDDSDAGDMPRPRVVSELPRRPAPRVARTAAAVASDAGRRPPGGGGGVGRGTSSPRSPLHEKRAVGAGAGPRVAELEAKLEKANDQLADMREQLAAVEKVRKEAHGAFVEARERSTANKRDAATWTPADDELGGVPAKQQQQQKQQAEAVTFGVVNGGDEDRRSVVSMTFAAMADDLERSAVGDGEARGDDQHSKKTIGGEDDEVNDVAVAAEDDDGKKGDPEADELRMKLAAKDKEVYEVRAKLMVKDMEVEELRVKLAAKDTAVGALTAKLVAKDAEIATLRADNAALVKISEAAKETAAEHSLRESAAREARLAERVRSSERAREELEAEAQRSRVQSEQWRKAAEEAAAVLGGADRALGLGARRGSDTGKVDSRRLRRRHMSSAGSNGGSGAETADTQHCQDGDGAASSGGKRKSGATGVAMRVLSGLWKKGHK